MRSPTEGWKLILRPRGFCYGIIFSLVVDVSESLFQNYRLSEKRIEGHSILSRLVEEVKSSTCLKESDVRAAANQDHECSKS